MHDIKKSGFIFKFIHISITFSLNSKETFLPQAILLSVFFQAEDGIRDSEL